MKITVKGNAKELAAFVVGLQKRQAEQDLSLDEVSRAVVERINRIAETQGKFTLRV